MSTAPAIARRSFSISRAVPVRPPWAVSETAFAEACTGCGKCVAACPQGIIGSGRGRLPVVDFARGGCTFCGACAEACAEPCFVDRSEGFRRGWSLLATVSTACMETKGVACRACEDACDAGAFRFRPRIGGGAVVSVIDAACTACGACVSRCPAAAISLTSAESQGVAA